MTTDIFLLGECDTNVYLIVIFFLVVVVAILSITCIVLSICCGYNRWLYTNEKKKWDYYEEWRQFEKMKFARTADDDDDDD